MSFHPNNSLPDCMMPDGGQCCAGYAAMCNDWNKLCARIEALEAALRELLALHDSDHQTDNDVAIADFIRAALAGGQDKMSALTR